MRWIVDVELTFEFEDFDKFFEEIGKRYVLFIFKAFN